MTKIALRQNTGRAFQVQNTSARAPKYIGKAQVGGREWRVAMWEKEARNGVTYLNLDFDEPWIWIDSMKAATQKVEDNPE